MFGGLFRYNIFIVLDFGDFLGGNHVFGKLFRYGICIVLAFGDFLGEE